MMSKYSACLAFASGLLSISCSNSKFDANPKSRVVSPVSADAKSTENSAQPSAPVMPIIIPDDSTSTTDVVAEDDALFKNCDTSTSSQFQAELYRLEPGRGSVPDFSTLTSSGKICLDQLNITRRDFSQGFPGVKDLFEWFALDVTFDLFKDRSLLWRLS